MNWWIFIWVDGGDRGDEEMKMGSWVSYILNEMRGNIQLKAMTG